MISLLLSTLQRRRAQLISFCRRYQTEWTACFCVLAVMTAAAMFTGRWCFEKNGYPTFALQANAWLQGRLDLGQDYPWLELAIYEGKYYVSFPPFPSYVLLPFALFFGTETPDGLISLFFTLAGVWTAVRLAESRLGHRQEALFWVLFLYLGTGYLFIAMTPAVWFFAQVLCFNLSVLAVAAADRGRGGRSLLYWACAVGCRPIVILFLPVLLVILVLRVREKDPGLSLLSLIRKYWYWALGPLVLGGSYMLLNGLRFGNVLEFGHNYLPEFTRSPEGQFSLNYLKTNLPLLFRLPQVQGGGVFSFPTFDTALFCLIDPLSLPILFSILWAFFARTEEPGRRLRFLLPVLSLFYILILCTHRTLGGWQFGNRYLKDVLPWLFYGLLCWMPKRGWFRQPARALFFFGLAINLIGTVATFNNWI